MYIFCCCRFAKQLTPLFFVGFRWSPMNLRYTTKSSYSTVTLENAAHSEYKENKNMTFRNTGYQMDKFHSQSDKCSYVCICIFSSCGYRHITHVFRCFRPTKLFKIQNPATRKRIHSFFTAVLRKKPRPRNASTTRLRPLSKEELRPKINGGMIHFLLL
jgi:hypothetical protein